MMKQAMANQIIVECVAADCPVTELATTLNTGLPSRMAADPLLSDNGTMV